MPKYCQYLVLKAFVLCCLVPLLACGRSSKSQGNPGQDPLAPEETPGNQEPDDANENATEDDQAAAIAAEENKSMEESKLDKDGADVSPSPTEILLVAESVRSVKGQFFAKIEWLAPPSAERENRLVLIIASKTLQAPESLRILEFKPWMKIHNHGSGHLVPKWKVMDAEHIFEVENIYFIMSGPWELKRTAEIDGEVDELEFQFEVP